MYGPTRGLGCYILVRLVVIQLLSSILIRVGHFLSLIGAALEAADRD